MYKLVVLSCVISAAFAGIIPTVEYHAQYKSIVEPHVSVVETPTISHVGSVISSIPTGVSHHSSSVIHSDAKIVEPIYAHGVEKKIISTPIVKKVVEHVPAVVAQPLTYHHSYPEKIIAAPAIHYTSAHVPAVHSYAHSYAHSYSPLSYAHHY